jgi:hypothetical protein
MNGFAKGRLDAEPFSDHRRRYAADREVEEATKGASQLRILPIRFRGLAFYSRRCCLNLQREKDGREFLA